MTSIKVKDRTGGQHRRTQLLTQLDNRQLEVWKVEEGGGHIFIVTGDDKLDS